MKILLLTNRLPYPLNDGGNIATYYNLKFLKKQGHTVSLFSLNTNKHFENPENLKDVVSNIETFNINTNIKKSEALRSFFSPLPYNAKRFFSAACAQKLKVFLQANAFDILQLEGPYMFLYETILRKFSTAKIVYRAHNIEYKIWERQAANEKNILKRFYLKNLARKIKHFETHCINSVDAIIAISKDDEKIIQSINSKKPITTIPAGIDLTEYKLANQAPKPNTLCFIGSLQWMPNLQGLNWFLNEVWQSVTDKNNQLQFHVAGKNPPNYLANKLMNGYVFHGMVASQQDFINEHEILIVPLLSGSGMRIKIIEALALKKCIISTAIGCEGINLTQKQNVWIANTPEQMNEAIIYLTENEEERNRIAENGYTFVKANYDWNNLVLRFEAAYKSLHN